ncbi:2Fe-2S iron-sulfur cluster-binding protein [Natrarchaeobaculum sulfurireducens]|uniref:Soluble [2Fe-2S] ferredoxin n=1 Tax=Natrarchaeobaculum sulfurireducens TaxID=2044521 RepID=A0A346PUR3_9EURY|nr:2Fe-2S iron-sulfur cluster-binding protein [Natrarchaeobaculum sulfurireducens]AXR83258.1 soluble [2Fe-2S] ferredoxin [Natrarchaeobaculum sulfurireducens]
MIGHEVTLEWPGHRRRTVTVPSQETVLEAASRAGVRLPYDCRSGTCITCVGRLLSLEREADSGEDEDGTTDSDEPLDAALAFDYRSPPEALTDQERADGYVLLCIATPRADCRVRVGPMVRAEVGDSPWS